MKAHNRRLCLRDCGPGGPGNCPVVCGCPPIGFGGVFPQCDPNVVRFRGRAETTIFVQDGFGSLQTTATIPQQEFETFLNLGQCSATAGIGVTVGSHNIHLRPIIDLRPATFPPYNVVSTSPPGFPPLATGINPIPLPVLAVLISTFRTGGQGLGIRTINAAIRPPNSVFGGAYGAGSGNPALQNIIENTMTVLPFAPIGSSFRGMQVFGTMEIENIPPAVQYRYRVQWFGEYECLSLHPCSGESSSPPPSGNESAIAAAAAKNPMNKPGCCG